MDAYWRAANYLSVGQIYLFDNMLFEHKQYINKYGEDLPEIRNWKWSAAQTAQPIK
jgi:phosphoketolase